MSEPFDGHDGEIAVWRTASGELVPVEKMETSHLMNAMLVLERRAAREFNISLQTTYFMVAALKDEDGLANLEDAIRQQEEEGAEAYLPPIFFKLQEQLSKRGDYAEKYQQLKAVRLAAATVQWGASEKNALHEGRTLACLIVQDGEGLQVKRGPVPEKVARMLRIALLTWNEMEGGNATK